MASLYHNLNKVLQKRGKGAGENTNYLKQCFEPDFYEKPLAGGIKL